ncbi:PREDICTED: uncharacterized protein LOC109170852 [Ipomoea nil]|uniref:uncharacterized protein LOC109170852 n=1 Tax=Ipomoea nil TaxID=35883 RepID=UPI000900EE56|nr:PREDICTED: uncharacterized protein LOC109170852 [Ipomoea nil]
MAILPCTVYVVTAPSQFNFICGLSLSTLHSPLSTPPKSQQLTLDSSSQQQLILRFLSGTLRFFSSNNSRQHQHQQTIKTQGFLMDLRKQNEELSGCSLNDLGRMIKEQERQLTALLEEHRGVWPS